MTATQTISEIRVWDGFIRLFHWSLALCVVVAAGTGFLLGPRWDWLHLWAGGIAAALVAARILWGFLGPTHARFAGFLRSPAETATHVHALVTGARGRRYIGHNPLGALMIVTVLAAILALAATGLLTLGGMFKSGPLASAVPFTAGAAARDLHEALAILAIALVALHLAGVAVESRRDRDPLVAAMLHGRKPGRPGDAGAPERPAHPGAAIAIGAVLGGIALAAGLVLAARPVPGLPVAPAAFLPAYASECSDCHAAFNPSLLPAASWAGLMADLGHHFGEDASLDPATARAIAAWLQGHAAESADTLPAHRFRRVSATHPGQITATPFWRHMHAGLSEATFAAAQVRSRANCGACHADAAAGLFRPSSIHIPKEARN